MAHVVETGAGLSNSNAYLSYLDADAYFADHGAPAVWTPGAGTQAAKEQAIRLATQYLDIVYGQRFKGRRVLGTQALQWPRANVWSRDEWWYDSTLLPTPLLHATAEAALKSLSGDTLLPDLAAGTAPIESESMTAGPVSYSVDYGGTASPYKTYTAVEYALADLLRPGSLVEYG